jgi:hypothetical protein
MERENIEIFTKVTFRGVSRVAEQIWSIQLSTSRSLLVWVLPEQSAAQDTSSDTIIGYDINDIR